MVLKGGEIMQLNTTSYQSILDSLCNELELNEQVILDIIDSAFYMFQQIIKYYILTIYMNVTSIL